MSQTSKHQQRLLQEKIAQGKAEAGAYEVTQLAHTQTPYTGRYTDHFPKQGVYRCICCEQVLFDAHDKFDAGCGWPSFDRVAAQGVIAEQTDIRYNMRRTEALCANCHAHLGHVFNDGPTETGMRYCINSSALDYEDITK